MSASAAEEQVRLIEIPDFCLVVLIGSTGAGKSSFAARQFLPTEVIGSGWARGRVADDETDQAATADAFALVHAMAALRLKNRRLTVIDATNVRREDRKQWVELARAHHALHVAVVADPGEEVCVARNAERSRRPRPHEPRVSRTRLGHGRQTGHPAPARRGHRLSRLDPHQPQQGRAALGQTEGVARGGDPVRKNAHSFTGVLRLAATLEWLKP